MIVIDASVIGSALLDRTELGERARETMTTDDRWIMPEIWLIETLSIIRGRFLGGKIGDDQATEAIATASALDPVVPPTRMLAERIWELRRNVTTYDAAYVAAAESYGCALVTHDARLAKADGAHCDITLLN